MSALPYARRIVCLLLPLVVLSSGTALAHGVADADAAFVAEGSGARVAAFMYLGAKHMVTGYDHLLFLAGVVFFLRDLRQVATYVTLFALGHSLTLIGCVLSSFHTNELWVDTLIALSVVYKAVENLGPGRSRARLDPRAAVFAFGLVHGVGLASKLQTLRLSSDGLLANLLAFNAGVELGQLCALSLLVLALAAWRESASFRRYAVRANQVLMLFGFVLVELQLATYFLEQT